MIYHFLLFIKLFLCFFKQTTSQSWSVTFYSQNIPINNDTQPFILHKGIFLPISVKVTPLEESPQHDQITISPNPTESNIIIMTPQNLTIDTRDALIYQIYLGIKCDTEGDPSITLSFQQSDPNFFVSNIYIKIEKYIQPLNVNFLLSTQQALPINSYGLMYIEEDPLLNVDDFTIKFTSIDTENVYVIIDDFEITSFLNESLFTYTKYKILNNDTELPSEVELNVITDNKCIKLPETVIIKRTNTSYLPSPNDSMSSIIKSTVQKETDTLSTITITMNIDYAPDVLKCALQEFSSPQISLEDLRNFSLKNDSMYLQYSYLYFEEPGEKEIVFNNISMYLDYKMICELESPSLDNVESFVFTIGYFEDADIMLELKYNDISPSTSYCLNWIFSKQIDNEEEFMKKSIDYCYEYFVDMEKPRRENGCIECVQRNVTGLYSVDDTKTVLGMCVKSKETCYSQYDGDLKRKFDDLVRDLDNIEDIEKSIEIKIPNDTSLNVRIENDEEEPDLDKIRLGENFEVSEDNVTFIIYSTGIKKVECYAMVQQRSEIDVQLAEYNKTKFIIDNNPEGPSHTLTIAQEYKNKLVNLLIRCYNLPQFKYKVKHTNDLVLAQFNYTVNATPSNDIISPVVCEDDANAYNPQCWAFEQHTMCELQTEIDLNVPIDKYKRFRKLKPSDKLIDIQNYTNAIDEFKNITDLLNKILILNDLLALLDCRTHIIFDECRSIKQLVQDHAFKLLTIKLNDKSIIQELNNSEGEMPGMKVKKSLITLFYSFNNPDSFTKNTTDEVISLLYRYYNNLDNLLRICNESNVISDVIKIYGTTLDNAFNLLRFNELDNKLNISNSTGLINDMNVLRLVQILNNLPNYLRLIEDKVLEFENVLIRLLNISSLNGTTNSYEFPDELITLNIPTEHLKNKYKISYLTFSVYDFYPLISFLQQLQIFTPAISIKAYNSKNEKVEVKDLEDNKRLNIIFSKLNDLSLKYCFYRTENELMFKHDGVLTNQEKWADLKELTCSTKHLSDFTVGGVDIGGSIYYGRLGFLMVLVIGILMIVIVLGLIAIYILFVTRKKEEKKEEEDNMVMDNMESGTLV